VWPTPPIEHFGGSRTAPIVYLPPPGQAGKAAAGRWSGGAKKGKRSASVGTSLVAWLWRAHSFLALSIHLRLLAQAFIEITERDLMKFGIAMARSRRMTGAAMTTFLQALDITLELSDAGKPVSRHFLSSQSSLKECPSAAWEARTEVQCIHPLSELSSDTRTHRD
jgi:hypothetical protein